MLHNNIERLRKAFWNFRQPLTLRPRTAGVPISDLFVWRKSDDWQTFFELTDIASLFTGDWKISDRHVTLIFFDEEGAQVFEKRLELAPAKRMTLDISSLAPQSAGSSGTFCVFHSDVPPAVTELGSYLAERGYASYLYKKAPLRTYVHGNLDAIAQLQDMSLQLLGGSSFVRREYRLQYELSGPALYEAAIVNPSKTKQRISCQLLSVDGRVMGSQEVWIKPRGCHVFPIRLENQQTGRVVINSRLVMARPLIFRSQSQTMDVFHG